MKTPMEGHGFLCSAVKCGEDWDHEHEKASDLVMATLREQATQAAEIERLKAELVDADAGNDRLQGFIDQLAKDCHQHSADLSAARAALKKVRTCSSVPDSVMDPVKQALAQSGRAEATPPIYTITPELAASLIVEDISDRRGLKDQWREIIPSVREEIAATWTEIISRVRETPAPNR